VSIATATKSSASATANQPGGKFLTFLLGREEYGLEIMKVREIIRYVDVTHVPRVPNYVDGVINLRGQVIPVINLRRKFGMADADRTEETCIIVVDVHTDGRRINTGIVVDRVSEVLMIAGEQIDEPPTFDASVSAQFILGIGKVGKTMKILLSIDEVLTTDDLTGLADMQKQVAAE
jgi:purine-binding chemotaxis protein CheW